MCKNMTHYFIRGLFGLVGIHSGCRPECSGSRSGSVPDMLEICGMRSGCGLGNATYVLFQSNINQIAFTLSKRKAGETPRQQNAVNETYENLIAS